ncbi:FkbM family methyltransferase [Candidatus Woesearchaeota archaeon]|nr:FkbM family methyltransferase [Candidatus Woesearchaeota archaeon]
MAEEHKKNQMQGSGKSAFYFIVRVIKFLAFRLILGIRHIKFLLLKIKAKNSIIIRNVQGSKMYLNLKDRGISKDLALDGIREPESTKIIKKIIKERGTVVDIGANIGYYALMESQLVGKKGRVYAIEPVPDNIASLKKNIGLNDYSNIEVFQMGIGEKNKTAKMNITSYSNWHSFLHQRNVIGKLDVKVVTLDNFLKNRKYPDFIRMDVEGYEFQILKGMKNTLKKKKPLKLFIELHPHIMNKSQTKFLLKTLKDNGFETSLVIKCLTVTEMKVKKRSEYDLSFMKINDMLEDAHFLTGKKGAFEIFFERG